MRKHTEPGATLGAYYKAWLMAVPFYFEQMKRQ